MRLRHIFILLILFVLVFTASSCVSRVMYEDGQFDSTDMLENADENNYSEVRVPLNFKDAWRLYSLKLIDTNGDNIPDRWENISKYDASVVNEGMLNYKRVGIITAGIIKADGTTPKRK